MDDPNRYPYFALMNGDGLCGAVLISKRFVLTAAHCVGADNDFEIGISQINDGTEYRYKRVFVHPNYNDANVNSDIAIYELEQDVPDNLNYIRLEQSPVNIVGTQLTVIGFGDTNPSKNVDAISDDLLQTNVDYVSQNVCIGQE